MTRPIMDSIANELAAHLISRLKSTPRNARLLVGVAGVPGSGKSVLANAVLARLHGLLGQAEEAIVVGMDGWHLSRVELDKSDDVEQAYARRGAHWTFDADAFVEFVTLLRAPLPETPSPELHILSAPSFDHAKKDPIPSSVHVRPTHRIVLIEGLYVLLDVEPWSRAGSRMDERWFLDVDKKLARQRLIKRHVETGVGKDLQDAIWRAENNDLPNGEYILRHMLPTTRRIKTVEDASFVAASKRRREDVCLHNQGKV